MAVRAAPKPKRALLAVEIDPQLKVEFAVHCKRKGTYQKQEIDRLLRRAIAGRRK